MLNDKIISLSAEILALKKELIVDKIETPQDYGRTLFDLFVSQRLNKYPELQWQLKDSVYFVKKQEFKEAIKKIEAANYWQDIFPKKSEYKNDYKVYTFYCLPNYI